MQFADFVKRTGFWVTVTRQKRIMFMTQNQLSAKGEALRLRGRIPFASIKSARG